MANGDTPLTGNPIPKTMAGIVNRALAKGTPVEAAVLVGKSQGGPKIVVVPRRRGDGGVVKGMKAAREVQIRTSADLPSDIPSGHVLTIARAWEKGWSVIQGERLKDDESRILIGGNGVQVSLVWNAEGRSGVFVRSSSSSITHRADSGPQAIALAAGEEEWPWTNAGKNV
jgi:hypothetical protein